MRTVGTVHRMGRPYIRTAGAYIRPVGTVHRMGRPYLRTVGKYIRPVGTVHRMDRPYIPVGRTVHRMPARPAQSERQRA